MNIQIFGKAKCFETKKALRYFKERKIPVQYIDLMQKPMSKGEYRSVKTAVGGWQAMVNEKAKGYEDCVVFMSEDGVSVVVSTGEEGLQTEDIARITDIVKQETGLSAESIKIMEVN